MQEILIRSATLADCPAILQVMREAFAAYESWLQPPSGSRQETAASLEQRLAHGACFVAIQDEQLVGSVFCERQGDDCYFGRLAVRPRCQGQGIGGYLLAAVEDWARQKGAMRITLGVRQVLTDNIRFFEKHGFVIYGEGTHAGFERPTWYKMEKRMGS